MNWERAGFVFDQIRWAREEVPRTKGIWAPDISFFNGLYHLYYSVSRSAQPSLGFDQQDA